MLSYQARIEAVALTTSYSGSDAIVAFDGNLSRLEALLGQRYLVSLVNDFLWTGSPDKGGQRRVYGLVGVEKCGGNVCGWYVEDFSRFKQTKISKRGALWRSRGRCMKHHFSRPNFSLFLFPNFISIS